MRIVSRWYGEPELEDQGSGKLSDYADLVEKATSQVPGSARLVVSLPTGKTLNDDTLEFGEITETENGPALSLVIAPAKSTVRQAFLVPDDMSPLDLHQQIA